MKDKEKQIIEKAIDILYDLYDFYKGLTREQLENTIKRGGYSDAVKLVKLGYRKLPENSVVLSREEYESDLTLQYDTGYEWGSKETAEKILRGLIKNCQFTFGVNGKPIIALDGDFALNTAKSYGVEIKE